MLWTSPFAYLERCRHRHGSRFTINATSRPPLVMLGDAEDIKAVLTAPADVLCPGEGADTVEPIVGRESFMLLDGAAHLTGRRAVLPPLCAMAVTRHAALVSEIAQREVASWPRGVPFALHPRLCALTLQTALRTVTGAAERTGERELSELQARLLAMLSVNGSAALSEPLLRNGPGRRAWRRFLRERTETDQLIYELIRRREGHGGDVDNVLARLLSTPNADGSTLSAKQVRDNLMSIILAGHETTASQLAWAFQLLAHHPAVLHRLTEEIDADRGEEYLTATIHEVLRHRPVFLFAIPRAVKRPIDIGGWNYRSPTQLLGCTYLLHHDPRLYPEPHAFRPERFLDAAPPKGAWLPWGGGRRRCPGLHLAMLDMKVVLRTVLATTTVRPATDSIEQPRWRSVIVTPGAGSRVVLQQRNRTSSASR